MKPSRAEALLLNEALDHLEQPCPADSKRAARYRLLAADLATVIDLTIAR